MSLSNNSISTTVSTTGDTIQWEQEALGMIIETETPETTEEFVMQDEVELLIRRLSEATDCINESMAIILQIHRVMDKAADKKWLETTRDRLQVEP